jgi:hypothetical protein
MICVNNFHFCLIARHIDIVRHFIATLIYFETSGQILKQEGVYVTSLFAHTEKTYSLRTLACK